MQDRKKPKIRRFTAEEIQALNDYPYFKEAVSYGIEAAAPTMVAIKVESLETEVSDLRKDLADLKGIFGRIASAMEEANAIKREESAPPKKAAGKLNKVERK